jgi:hypothetical protein
MYVTGELRGEIAPFLTYSILQIQSLRNMLKVLSSEMDQAEIRLIR